MVGRASTEVEVRRVGFRTGTIAELAEQHLVESEIEAERRPGSGPQPFESYVSFARSLPSQFDDHTWVATAADGTPVGCAACWSNAAGDLSAMQGYVYVRRQWRRRGIGWRLLQQVVDETLADGRSTLVWTTYDALAGGEAFSRRVGGRIGRLNRNSELLLVDVDWGRVESWVADASGQAAGYWLEFWDGPLPEYVMDDAARFHQLMNTQPHDELETGDVHMDAAQAAEVDRHLAESGRQRWTLYVRDREGRLVAGTELTFEPWDPGVAQQQNTATDPAHRGRGLAKWAKAAMLLRLRNERPEVLRVRTGNAFSNDAMLAINRALGFEVTEVRTEWQGAAAALRSALSEAPSR